jgi:TetR/AcrR family tetracycline transcriptional repressor
VALDREQIAKAALDLMDEVGLDALSLRRLAKELGIQAPALYWHFKNKQELLDEMAALTRRTGAPGAGLRPGEAWEDWLAERARAIHAALLRHRDGAKLSASTRPHGSQWAEIEQQMEVLCGAGFAPGDALRGMLALSNYVNGFSLEEQADRLRDGAGGTSPAAEQVGAWLANLARYPLLAEGFRQAGDPQNDAAFEHGLRLLIEGMRSDLARRGGAAARSSTAIPANPRPERGGSGI